MSLGFLGNDGARTGRQENKRNGDHPPADAHENTPQPKRSLNAAGAESKHAMVIGSVGHGLKIPRQL
jgi:hypothetical protein